jgi:hypothetical protein
MRWSVFSEKDALRCERLKKEAIFYFILFRQFLF